MPDAFSKQLGAGVSSLTFGVALAIFVYAAPSAIGTASSLLLFAASFLLMLRFWWRYNELFVRFAPSRTYWHFLLDFLVSFFGILAVLSVNNLQAWALLGALAMLSSAARCGLSWGAKGARGMLRRTLAGAAAMLVFMGAIYGLAPLVEHSILSAAILAIVLVFVVYSSARP